MFPQVAACPCEVLTRYGLASLPPMGGTWVFGYGSLIWKPGFVFKAHVRGYVKGYKRVFYQGSTDHRGVPGAPGRVVTLTEDPEAVTWGVAYEIEDNEHTNGVMQYLEIREKQYDLRVRADLYTPDSEPEPAVRGVLMYVASSDRATNTNFLGPAPLDEIAQQIATSIGPSGRNSDYIFELQSHFEEIGIPDPELFALAERVRYFCTHDPNAGKKTQTDVSSNQR